MDEKEQYIDKVVKKEVIQKIRGEAVSLPIHDLSLALETKKIEIENTITNKESKVSYTGIVTFALEANNEQICEFKGKFKESSIEIENIQEVVGTFAKVKTFWHKCDICGKQIPVIIYLGRVGSDYEKHDEYIMEMSIEDGREMRFNFDAVYKMLQQAIWLKRDEIVKTTFKTLTIDTFEQLKEFREFAEETIDSIKGENFPLFGCFEICSDCQEKIKPGMTLEEIANLLPDFREIEYWEEYWDEVKESQVKCEF